MATDSKKIRKPDKTYVRGRTYETTYRSYPFDDKPKKLPPIAISPVTHLIQGFNFILTLNNFTYGFKEISGLRVENPVDYIQEGGVNDHKLMVGEPSNEAPTLECKRGLMLRCLPIITDAARMAAALIPNNLARKAALLAVNTQDPQATLEQGPAIGTIEVYDRQKRLSAMYSFLSLGMTSWECDSLSADNSDISIESITIAHTGLIRIPLGAPNTFFGYLPGESEDSSDVVATADLEAELAEERKKLREKPLEEQNEYEKHLADLEDQYEKLKKDLEDAKADKQKELDDAKAAYEANLEKIKKDHAAAKEKAKEAQDAAQAKADEREEKKKKEAEESAKKGAATKEAAEKAKEEAKAKREKQIEDREKELADQAKAVEEADVARSEAEQAAKDKAKENQDAAAAKAEEAEAKKQGGS